MYLSGADLIDMTVKQLEMLEEILRHDARSFAERARRCGPRCAPLSRSDRRDSRVDSKTGRRARDAATERTNALPGCANEDEL